MRNFFKKLVCVGLVLIFTTTVALANDDGDGSGVTSVVINSDNIIEITVE